MGLTSRLLRVAAARPHALIVAPVGGTSGRLAVEAELARRGWPVADHPADADLLVVTAAPGPEVRAVIERLWRQIPHPKARVEVAEPEQASAALALGAAHLADCEHQLQHVAAPAPVEHHPTPGRNPDHGHESHSGDREPGAGGGDGHGDGHDGAHVGATADARGRGGPHTGHDSGMGGGMEMPGGLPMADLGPDRDGLTLDRLHVPLGPVLPDWPPGLVLHVVLQGDVIQEVETQVLDPGEGGPSFWHEPGRAAPRELDALARFLAVAGWYDLAARSRRLRDVLLTGAPLEQVHGPAAALVGRVGRSRTLRRLLRDLPAGPGDVADLLGFRLAAVRAALGAPDSPPASRVGLDELADLLLGAELAAARVIVAMVDPDTEPVTSRPVGHG